MFGLSQSDKNKALAKAISDEDFSAAEKALRRGADPNAPYGDHVNALFKVVNGVASRNINSYAMVLINHGLDLGMKDEHGRTALFYAAQMEGEREVLFLQEQGGVPDVNICDKRGRGLIPYLAERGYWKAIAKIFDQPQIQEFRDDKEKPLLQIALNGGAPADLLSKIADITGCACDVFPDGSSALHDVVMKGYDGAYRFLRDRYTIPVNVLDKDGNNILAIAAANKKLEMVKILLQEKDLPLNAVNNKGHTALYYACAEEPKIADLILDEMIARDLKFDIQPVIEIAVSKCEAKIWQKLLTRGAADLNVRNKDGKTLLMVAVTKGWANDTQTLLDAGADPLIKDNDGKTAAQQPKNNEKPQALSVLKKHLAALKKKAGPQRVFRYVDDDTIDVVCKNGLTITFNFWMQQVIYRDGKNKTPPTPVNFDEVQNQLAIEEARKELLAQGGNPPLVEQTSHIVKKVNGVSNAGL